MINNFQDDLLSAFRFNSILYENKPISLTSYFCSRFCECRQCLSKWEVQTWYMAPCQNRWDFGLLLKLVSPRFMDSTLSYGPKRNGRPSMELAVTQLHCVLFPVIIKMGSKNSSSFILVRFFLCDTILIITREDRAHSPEIGDWKRDEI